METYYANIALAHENTRLAHEKAAQYRMIKEAEAGGLHRPRSRMLVKLAGILIRTGLRLKSYAEKDLKSNFTSTTLQDLKS